MAKKIKVMVGQLTEQLSVKSIEEGTELGAFLKANGYEYNAQVRVNAESEKAGYKLRADDIITIIGEVNGGKI
jgi:hypothetical protein